MKQGHPPGRSDVITRIYDCGLRGPLARQPVETNLQNRRRVACGRPAHKDRTPLRAAQHILELAAAKA
ncbi:MAG: hypothetical protein K8J31_11415 [Anaerolineae bacterium]|nr:hypothetical protein [Anaerolineae bacterium]